jgi:hypothetical protein
VRESFAPPAAPAAYQHVIEDVESLLALIVSTEARGRHVAVDDVRIQRESHRVEAVPDEEVEVVLHGWSLRRWVRADRATAPAWQPRGKCAGASTQWHAHGQWLACATGSGVVGEVTSRRFEACRRTVLRPLNLKSVCGQPSAWNPAQFAPLRSRGVRRLGSPVGSIQMDPLLDDTLNGPRDETDSGMGSGARGGGAEGCIGENGGGVRGGGAEGCTDERCARPVDPFSVFVRNYFILVPYYLA